ncbi:Hint domain-containing protein [Neolewinella lacunae]|uniref:Intein C-terminal splicing domain-containing protein n=1 Tax=Neolewinella lacunae TaxID=1517758 RepID=A0A923T6U3_9BACT|nr:Hint domain-containing protein [Neolewinella lacunae]MBC6992874.1 hypothetical protein [Neolewinella lacunae]MDN3633762.1 Hint domain-containing protein [Neolewinella lacunae]
MKYAQLNPIKISCKPCCLWLIANIKFFTTLLLFLGGGEFVSAQGQAEQDCYVHEDKFNMNGSRVSLYDHGLYQKACELKALINTPSFDVVGHDYWSIMQAAFEQQYFDQAFTRASQYEAENRTFFYLVAKNYQSDNKLTYRVKLVLPDSGPFSTLTVIQRSAIEAEVLTSINAEAANKSNSIGHNARAEEAGLVKLLDFVRQIQSGNLVLNNPWEKAGFIAMAVDPSEQMGRTVGGPPSAPIRFGGNVIHDFAGLEVTEGGNSYLLENDIKAGVQALSLPSEIVEGLDYAYIVTDDLNSIGEMDAADQKFEMSQERIVVWLHHASVNNAADSVRIKSKSNLSIEESERIVNYLFDQMLLNWYPEATQAAAKEEDGGVAKALCETTPDCSPSWNWGEACLLCYAKNNHFLPFSQFEAGFAIGLFDGILGTIQLLYESAEKKLNFFKRAWIYLGSLHKHYIEHESVKSVLYKVSSDAKDVVKELWDQAVEVYETIYPIVQQMDVDSIKRILGKIIESFKSWVGDFLVGDAGPAYDIGIIAFELILAFFSGGTSIGLRLGAKAGAKVLPKILKFLKKFHDLNDKSFAALIDEIFSGVLKRSLDGLPENPVAYAKSLFCKIALGGCFVAGTPVLLAAAPVPIDSVQLFDYVVAHATINQPDDPEAYDPYTSAQQRQRDNYELDSTNWYEVGFAEVNGSSSCRLALHQEWMAVQGIAEVGQLYHLNLPEQGLSGPAHVTSIRHILPQKRPVDENPDDDFGFQPVTAIFTHRSNDVWTLRFDNGDSLGVTYNHPIYSVTAQDWRLAGELTAGEEVLTRSGTAFLTEKARSLGVTPVWNLEVKGWHNFLVGVSGIVVHNTGNCFNKLLDLFFNLKFGKWTRKRVEGKKWVDYINESGIPSLTEIDQLESLGEKLKMRMVGLDKSPQNGRNFPGIDALIEGGNPLSLKTAGRGNEGGALRELISKANNLNDGIVESHEGWVGSLNNKIDGMITAKQSTKSYVRGRWESALADPGVRSDIVENLYIEAQDGWLKWSSLTREWTDIY